MSSSSTMSGKELDTRNTSNRVHLEIVFLQRLRVSIDESRQPSLISNGSEERPRSDTHRPATARGRREYTHISTPLVVPLREGIEVLDRLLLRRQRRGSVQPSLGFRRHASDTNASLARVVTSSCGTWPITVN